MSEMAWRDVTAHIDVLIENVRDRLEARGQAPTETEFLRGVLSAYREILQLPETTTANQSDRYHAAAHML